ncbi:MAG: glutamate racemase [Oscillospiraceae bacterium]|jgi:glutamate racemase|nr:glutamate racemase [Oscillospiraceae bacterium]
MDNRPIGVFDSGLGGLTTVGALGSIAPGEDIIYLGDTGRVPYGSRSRDTIIRYASQALTWFTVQNVKAVIIACGTVSSAALPRLVSTLPLFGVVEPASSAAARLTTDGSIGVIATNATIRSKAYEATLAKISIGSEVISRACPLFVPLVESGYIAPDNPIVKAVIADHLADLRGNVDTLLLGCTHYPLLRDAISDFMGSEVAIIDAGAETAAQAMKKIKPSNRSTPGTLKCYVTDRPEDFEKLGSLFLGRGLISDVNQITLDG